MQGLYKLAKILGSLKMIICSQKPFNSSWLYHWPPTRYNLRYVVVMCVKLPFCCKFEFTVGENAANRHKLEEQRRECEPRNLY